jgi:hypothetical protein
MESGFDADAVPALAQAPILLVFSGLGTAAIASSVRSVGLVQFAAALGPANAACCLAAVALILWRSRHAQLRGGYLVAAALAASLLADILTATDEFYGVSPAGATPTALPLSLLYAPADAMLRTLARALYAVACARWLADIQPTSWASAGALAVIPAAAAIACAQQAIGEAAAAAAGGASGRALSLAQLAPPVGLESDARYTAACLDAVGAVALASICTLRLLAVRLAPAPRRGAPSSSVVPASQAAADARQLLQRLAGLYPLALVAGLALLAALGALRFPAGRRVNAGWLASVDWSTHADGCRALLDAVATLTVARCARAQTPRAACPPCCDERPRVRVCGARRSRRSRCAHAPLARRLCLAMRACVRARAWVCARVCCVQDVDLTCAGRRWGRLGRLVVDADARRYAGACASPATARASTSQSTRVHAGDTSPAGQPKQPTPASQSPASQSSRSRCVRAHAGPLAQARGTRS